MFVVGRRRFGRGTHVLVLVDYLDLSLVLLCGVSARQYFAE